MEQDDESAPGLVILHVRDERPHARRFQAQLDALNTAAVTAARDAGWRTTLHATAAADQVEVLAACRAADAVLIMGGEDVDPRLYGGRQDYPGAGDHESQSDRILIAVILDAVRRRAPLLGVCRGHQLINVALGGTLVEHMHGHRARGADPFVRTRLTASESPGPADVATDGTVRCAHHQAVRDLGAGLKVVARASDGVIEAIAHEDAPVWGVQWHPEHPDTAATQLVGLLDRVHALGAQHAVG